MQAFHTTPNAILDLHGAGRLVSLVGAHLVETGYLVDSREQAAWLNSLPALARHLQQLGYGDLDALVEFQLPRSTRRVDVILGGAAPESGGDTYLVVELKQWSAATRYDDAENLVAVNGMGQPQLHPGVQVQAYCNYLVDFLVKLHEFPATVHGMAYLHNATRQRVSHLVAAERKRTYQSMVFTLGEEEKFARYLRMKFAAGRESRAVHRLLASPVRPSRQLLALAAQEIGRRQHFILLDDQREAYELVMRALRWAAAGRRKRVVVISGGPGSGKSAIALSLLATLAEGGHAVAHATGSKAFTLSLQRYAHARDAGPHQRTRPLFSFFRDFMNVAPDSVDVLICDEAHRMRERSDRNGVSGSMPQVEELIQAAKVPVFLLDDYQVVRPNEVGTVGMIVEAAGRLDLDVDVVNLGAQFRCGGSPRYERWVLHLLGLASSHPYRWLGDDDFYLGVVDSPETMEAVLRQRNAEGMTARISAGFCWDWTKQPQRGRLATDVRIGTWHRPWNAYGNHPPKGVPAGSYWATDPRGFQQIGCIYTAQGFEYDWSGVILGGDLVVRNGRFVSQPNQSKDVAIIGTGERPRIACNADRLIRNAYKVLLTRGLRGCLVYSVDDETQEFLQHLIPSILDEKAQEAPGVYPVGEGLGRRGPAQAREELTGQDR